MKSFASLIKLLIIIFVINHYIKQSKKRNKKVIKKQDTKTKNVMDIKEQTLDEIKTSDFLQFMADKINKQQQNTNINEIERMPKIEEAIFDSRSLSTTVPLVPNSPLVKSIIPTFLPKLISLMIVPPHPSSTSSGCAPKHNISSFI